MTSASAAVSSRALFAPLNLLLTFQDLVNGLAREVEAGHWLDAYLLGAGALQVLEDYVNRDSFALIRAATFLRTRRSAASRLAAGAALAAAKATTLSRRLPQQSRCLMADQDLAGVIGTLAALVQSGAHAEDSQWEVLRARTARLATSLAAGPAALQESVMRLPACFRSFDQQPEDMDRLTAAYLSRRSGCWEGLLVVGLRTSGSYLAPLVAASLAARGCSDVRWITVRPNRPWLQGTRRAVSDAVRRGRRMLVVDDPPASGSSILSVTQELERAGVPADNITLLLALLGPNESLPDTLRSHASVLLPWDGWAIHDRLSPDAVRRALTAFSPSWLHIEGMERQLRAVTTLRRGHTSELFVARIRDTRTDHQEGRFVFVEGCGLGYLGRHALGVAAALPGRVPEVYGQDAGLLYREWLTNHCRYNGDGPKPDAVADYVAYRERALAVAVDHSRSLAGQTPVWEVASEILSRSYGRLGLLLRLPVLDAVAKRLLQVSEPSIIDGCMGASQWFHDPGRDLNITKIGFADRAFSNLDLACYDSVFDLAIAAVDVEVREPAYIRSAFEEKSQRHVDGERWLLYQLVHLWDVERLTPERRSWARRASAKCVQDYFRDLYFADVTPSDTGELCAIDVDGVLETGQLGFSCPTPAGVAALRGLLRHGYRPVLVTGRSLDEVRERCRAYRLPGGVAEYGACVYLAEDGAEIDLLSESDRVAMSELRATLEAWEGVGIDADYESCVRAFCTESSGARSPLNGTTIAAVLQVSGHAGRVRVFQGKRQTDFVADSVNKGHGLRVLAARLGGTSGNATQVALAVGDSAADVPMFAVSRLPLAPRNADNTVRQSGVRLLGSRYQTGLAEAVSTVLGHQPLTCPRCSIHAPSGGTRLLLTALSAQENGVHSIPRQLALLVAMVVKGTLR